MEHSPTLAAKLRELPDSPGVYQMKDKRGRVVYVGKALSLRNRVPTYFTPGALDDPRIAELATKIADFDWVVVPSELDALMLESSLVRQLQPRYNIMLKDGRNYPYIKITLGETFPRVMLTRRYEPDGARYWGPMQSVTSVRGAVRFIAGLFQVRTCSLDLYPGKKPLKPCLDYHLKLCSGPCAGCINQTEYARLVKFAVDFFNGRYGKVLDELRARMARAAERRSYEEAARCRDLIASVEKSFARARVIGKPGEDMDVLGLAQSRGRACVMLMPVRDGHLLHEQKFILDLRLEETSPAELLAGFIKLRYANPEVIPPELVLPVEPEEGALLAQWMGGLRKGLGPRGKGLGEEGTEDRRQGAGERGQGKEDEGQGAGEETVGRAAVPANNQSSGGGGSPPSHPAWRQAPVPADLDAQTGAPAPTRGDSDPGLQTPDAVQSSGGGFSRRTSAPQTATEVAATGRTFKPIRLSTAPRGWRAELLGIAMRNAQERLHTELLSDSGDYVVTPGQQALMEQLGLPRPPRRIEGFDIANLQGKQATGAMSVLLGGRKAPREYRLFNIRLKDTPDDYAMLRETLTRRLTRLLTDPRWEEEVDLIMIDGGKGQLGSALEVQARLLAEPRWDPEQREKLARLRFCSLAKQEELVYFCTGSAGNLPASPVGTPLGASAVGAALVPPADAASPVPTAGGACPAPTQITELRLPHTDPGLRLLVELRNEAHRFGNSQHARLRDKAMRLSVLDTIPGLGPAKRAALLKHFGSVRRLREASEEELAAVEGLGPKLAAVVRRYLDRDAELEDGKALLRREMRIRRLNSNGVKAEG